MKSFWGILLFFAWASSSVWGQSPVHRKKLTLTGPPATVTFPLIYMKEKGYLKSLADEVDFKLWMNPDQLRAYALNGEADFLAMPSNVAANLYNKQAKIKLANISVWGILWVVSRDGNSKTMKDLQGEEIVMPFRGDMPDLIFQILAEKQGLAVKTDFKLRYVSNPLDAMQLLILRRADHVVLAEPAISMALRKTSSYPVKAIAPELHRGVDLQKEWARLGLGTDRMPQAGIVGLGESNTNRAVMDEFNRQYKKASEECVKHAKECAEMVAKHIDMLSPTAIEDSLRYTAPAPVNSSQAKKALEDFYRILLAKEPNLIGGKLPDRNFYE